MVNNQSNWLSIGQAAKYLGVSRDTLRRWEKAGKIKSVRSPTNRRYYTEKILNEALNPDKPSKINQKKSVSSKKIGKIVLSDRQKLILLGILSFLIAVNFALCLQFFILR